MLHVYVISDASGLSAETEVRAALAQFEVGAASVRYHRHVRLDTLEGALAAVRLAGQQGGSVVYTLADPQWAGEVAREAGELGVLALDALSPTVGFFAQVLQRPPSHAPHPQHRLDDSYFRRVEALEYTVDHDDGRHATQLPKADVVLVGVSRTSKTPLSMYLATRGHKVANVPLVLGVPPPEVVFTLPRSKVFGLILDAEALIDIRKRRLAGQGSRAAGAYASTEGVLAELDFARSIFRRGGWTVLNVTGRAIEETAAEIERQLDQEDEGE